MRPQGALRAPFLHALVPVGRPGTSSCSSQGGMRTRRLSRSPRVPSSIPPTLAFIRITRRTSLFIEMTLEKSWPLSIVYVILVHIVFSLDSCEGPNAYSCANLHQAECRSCGLHWNSSQQVSHSLRACQAYKKEVYLLPSELV